MNFFINHFEESVFINTFVDILDSNISLFVDKLPDQTNINTNPTNIMVLQEPNEYFGYHDWVIVNQNLFLLILTWDDKVLNNCPNSRFFPFGSTWMSPKQIHDRNKIFQISHLCGKLLKTPGQYIRHEILHRKNEIVNPTNFHHTIGDRNNIDDARIGKETVFGNSMFGVSIENTSHNGYFTEKIIDLFLLKTIPIYWGCSNINKFFNPKGIIQFKNADDFIEKTNMLTSDLYHNNIDVITENFNTAQQYIDYPKNIYNHIKTHIDFI